MFRFTVYSSQNREKKTSLLYIPVKTERRKEREGERGKRKEEAGQERVAFDMSVYVQSNYTRDKSENVLEMSGAVFLSRNYVDGVCWFLQSIHRARRRIVKYLRSGYTAQTHKAVIAAFQFLG